VSLPPVEWHPSDLDGPDSDGHRGRSGHEIAAIVHHRVVGTLESMTSVTFKPTTDNVLQAGERRVSSHFGIGYWGDRLVIHQYIALQDTAYCNGQSARDREACRWQKWIDLGRPPANEITVSIEHEDNAAGGRYIVREEIIAASIELDRLLLSGDAAKIRAAGIRCSDAAAAQLGALRPDAQTLITHNDIAPVSKPYCWKPIGGDAGFPQARYIAELSGAPAPEDPVKSFAVPERPTVALVKGGAWLYDNDALEPSPTNIQLSAGTNRPLGYVGQQSSTSPQMVAYDPPEGDADSSARAMWVRREDVVSLTPVPVAAPVDCSELEQTVTALTQRLANADGRIRAAVTALGGVNP
jgi:hypothetical protein